MLRLLTNLTIAGVVVGFSLGAWGADPLKRVTVEMKLQRGAVGQADLASLHFRKGAIDCSLNFYSQQSVSYVESFGSAAVPVVFDVAYSSDGKPSGANLVRVGGWNASKFQPNERALAVTQRVQLREPGAPNTLRIDSPGGCFDRSTSLAEKAYFSVATILPLLLSFANLGLLVAALLRGDTGATLTLEQNRRRTALWGKLGLGFASGSQVLYLALAAAWLFRWTRFYPGALIPTYSIAVGLALSVIAFVTALFGSGLKRIVGALVAITTAGLWLAGAVASVAV